MPLSDLELIDLHRAALYQSDEHGRLRAVNEPQPPYPPAPRFWMGRTPAGNRWSLRHDLPHELAAQLDRLLAAEPVTADLEPAPRMRESIVQLLARHAPVANEYRGPAYWIPEQPPVQGPVAIVTASNAAVLEQWFGWLVPCASDAECGPVAAALDRGIGVAVCHCARISAEACEAGVETVEAFRGRGYAPLAVSSWAAAVRDTGRLPMYSTWWANHASQAVANKLRMVQYGEDWSIE